MTDILLPTTIDIRVNIALKNVHIEISTTMNHSVLNVAVTMCYNITD